MKNKKLLLLLVTIFATTFATAQTTTIPDSNFEQELVDQGIDSDGAINGQVLTADIESVETLVLTGTFKPNAEKISDLTGIEDFAALRTLLCAGNFLTQLDVSNNLNLEDLQCQLNNITSLDVSNNLNLDLLYCNNNQLTQLDVSNNPMLSVLRCQSNQITTLDVTNLGDSLIELRCNSNDLRLSLDLSQNGNLITFSSTTNPDLLCIQVANANDANMGLGIYSSWSKPATADYSEDCDALYPTTDIPDDNFEAALIGLGHDNALDNRVLTANISGVTDLDVSGETISDLTGIEDFTSLTDLNVNDNDLVTLDLTQNTNLEVVSCNLNNLISINISTLTNLTDLDCSDNNLLALDVTSNDALENLNCSNNINIGTLDVTQNGNLAILRCINSGLSLLNIRFNLLLTEVYANINNLTILDTSQNIALQVVQVVNNQITSLDLSANGLLTQLLASNNNLEGSLDLSLKIILSEVNLIGNSSLYCIQVDNAIDADAGVGQYNLWAKDAFPVYSENCSDVVTYIPDDAFENYVETNFFGGTMDNYVLTQDIVDAEINELDMPSLGVADMTGIEAFIDLIALNISDNDITTLDVNRNAMLEVLECESNSISDLTLNTALTNLQCEDNLLESLDISQNPNLNFLDCNSNSLSVLDISGNDNLVNVNCSSNVLTGLTMAGSTNTNLVTLNASDNRLTEARVHHYTSLETLLLNDNFLANAPGNNGGIYLTPLVSLTTLDVTNNASLTCIMVADAAAASTNQVGSIYENWLKDAGASYSETCAGILSTEEFEALNNAIKVYPNPAHVEVFVSLPNDVTATQVSVYDIQARKVLETKNTQQGINVSSLSNGVYFLAIETDNYTITKKIIKE